LAFRSLIRTFVYLRDMADASDVESVLNEQYPGKPHIVTLAEVCRPQWLVEMECVALK
jgi:enamine deaminase RidA (YjgF/YER057c/UK114 family)